MAKLKKLTHERLIELLDYNPGTGHFVWRVARSNRVKIGSRAGVFHHASGGRYVSIDNEKFMSHRLAFLYVNKRWPDTDVRPLDGDYDNAAIENLGEVARVDLAHQRDKIKTNTSGFAGVSRSKHGRWQAKITWNYRQISLGGNFETAEAAGEAYQDAANKLKQTSSEADRVIVAEGLRLVKRKRAAWNCLVRFNVIHSWPSFEAFCADILDVPETRYAMVPVDVTAILGPGNFRWALPIESEISGPESRRARNEANRDHERSKQILRDYDLDVAEYQRMNAEQNGACAICHKPEKKSRAIGSDVARDLSVDHDHATGRVRGLLCGNCNQALGYFCDDPDVMRNAIIYLAKHSAKANAPILSPHRDWLLVASPGFGA